MEKAEMSILIQNDCYPSGTQDCRMQLETCEIVFQLERLHRCVSFGCTITCDAGLCSMSS